MEMINTKTITRNEAIVRIKYILGLIQLEFLDELGDTIDYDSEDLNMDDGRASHFNGYDGSTELETEDYYIYYHNQN